jgi:hypothetical protein
MSGRGSRLSALRAPEPWREFWECGPRDHRRRCALRGQVPRPRPHGINIHAELQLRVSARHLQQHRRRAIPAEQHRHAHSQPAGWCARIERSFGCFDFGQRAHATLVESLAVLRRRLTARRAMKQARAESLSGRAMLLPTAERDSDMRCAAKAKLPASAACAKTSTPLKRAPIQSLRLVPLILH